MSSLTLLQRFLFQKWYYDQHVAKEAIAENAAWTLLQNIVLCSHIIPMSIYVAIEVLKWFQTGLVFKDEELMKDPANFDVSRAALQESHD